MKSLDKRILSCQRCIRLRDFLAEVQLKHPDYHCKPVPAFGDEQAQLFILGLAPGMHGANATGRPFTGDYAGVLLYEALHRYGFSNQAESSDKHDGLRLINCRISNAVKCLPPQNKPNSDEVKLCNDFLLEELHHLPKQSLVLALGKLAHDALLRALQLRLSQYRFAHGVEHVLPNGMHLIDSYHCSRYNTQTKRLTPDMFYAIFERIRSLVGSR